MACRDISRSYYKNTNTPTPPKPQNALYPIPRQKFEKAAQKPEPVDESPKTTKEEFLRIKQVLGSILYYAQAADLTALMSLSTISNEQAEATKTTIKNTKQLLDYLATYPNSTMRFYASDIIMNIHLGASYHSTKGARSRASGHFFIGSLPKYGEPIFLKGAFYSLCTILEFITLSAAEA